MNVKQHVENVEQVAFDHAHENKEPLSISISRPRSQKFETLMSAMYSNVSNITVDFKELVQEM